MDKRFDNIDYEFRPELYWNVSDPLMAILVNVKGTRRRQTIRDFWKSSSDRMEGIGTVHFELQFSKDDLPLKKIVSGFHYAGTHEEPLLQLADACAFTVRCALQGKAKSIELLDALTNNKHCKMIGIEKTEGGNALIEFA